ncbi:MAG TPA: mechanosensitive ion channel domain-containing protein [Lacipirellulaceae bacterium]|nr:mechanosensitive ion channel domain-containing protein [Lacipirellulaceae bacterium]
MVSMFVSLLLLATSALQAPPPVAPAAIPPAASSAASSPARTVAPPPPVLSPGDAAELDKREALRDFRALSFARLTPEDWTYISLYYGVRALFVVILMTLAWTVSSWASFAVRAALGRVKFDETLSIFLAKLVRWAILLLGGMSCLGYFGIETTGFAAVIGALGLAIGLAFQGTLSNFAAGAMLLIFRPYKVGDSVVVAGNSGTVAEIELFTTALDTSDNRRVIIPNSSIFGAVIENHSANPVRRAEVLVGVAYAADIDATRAALDRAVAAVAQLDASRKSEVALLNLGPSSVDWAVRGWAKRDLLGDARQALVRAVKIELDRAGIGIPYPQLDIHIAPESVQERRAA